MMRLISTSLLLAGFLTATTTSVLARATGGGHGYNKIYRARRRWCRGSVAADR